MKRKVTSFIAALALLVTAGLTVAGQQGGPGPKDLEGKAAPDFTLQTLDGKEVKLSDQKGKVVLIDFWATWCPPCREGLPHIQKIADDTTMAEKGLVVWAVNVKETKDKIEPFMKEQKLTFAVPVDKDGAVMKKYNVSGIPTTLVIGRDGTVKKAFVGFGPGGEKQIHKAVEDALAEAEPSA